MFARWTVRFLIISTVSLLSACSPSGGDSSLPDDLPNGLLLALAQFTDEKDDEGLPVPGAARVELLLRRDGRWQMEPLEDERSNVFHKVLSYESAGGRRGLLSAGGSAALLSVWHRNASQWTSTLLWEEDFGGEFSRMRDVEVGDLFGDGPYDLAVATHDQGVVAVLRHQGGGEFQRLELDRRKDTFVHEIEMGDLDGDGVLEVYATPSAPNRMDGSAQSGQVVRYVPARGEGPVAVATLGQRHAKEILVSDVDGDGVDELYVVVEALTLGEGANLRLLEPVEIRRYDADTPPHEGARIARIQDRFCRFLTAGDVDGDGRKEMVAASFRSGLWLLRPLDDPRLPWSLQSIDRDSAGFEHAALLADLDEDGRDELYVASDRHGELRRYVWKDGGFEREIIHARAAERPVFTWNLATFPVSMLAGE